MKQCKLCLSFSRCHSCLGRPELGALRHACVAVAAQPDALNRARVDQVGRQRALELVVPNPPAQHAVHPGLNLLSLDQARAWWLDLQDAS